MKWIIDTSKDDNSNEKLIEALEYHKIEYSLFEYKPFMNYKDVLEQIRCTEKVMCYGTINFITKVRKCSDYLSPGCYCDFDKYRCSAYYYYLKEYLLNDCYQIISWRKIDMIANMGQIFIRPDSGRKLFTGVVTNYDDLRSDIGFSICGLEPETKVLIAPYKRIEKEWRFFVSENNVITGSLYHVNGEHIEKAEYDNEAYELALKISNLYIPDKVWSVDICKTYDVYGGEYRVLELNSFSCSGLYMSDVRKLVKYIDDINK